MDEYVIDVGNLTLEATIKLVSQLYNLPHADKYVFDFKLAHSFEPISLLYLSSEIRRCRTSRPNSQFSVVNYKQCGYAGHMGFFRSFGAEYGNYPGQASGSDHYVPITIYDAQAIRKDASENMIPVGEHVTMIMKDVVSILIKDKTSETHKVLSYALREIFRNVIEHSETINFGFCAQYWPSKEIASIAILDRGIGILKSLKENPHLSLASHVSAIEHALLPGVSGKMFEGKPNDPYNDWQNSGYGLYMTSEICKWGGSFLLASGDTALKLQSGDVEQIDLYLQGTLVNLTIDTSKVTTLDSMLKTLRDGLVLPKGSLKASKASINFK